MEGIDWWLVLAFGVGGGICFVIGASFAGVTQGNKLADQRTKDYMAGWDAAMKALGTELPPSPSLECDAEVPSEW